ncbi:MAG: 1,6-anhydro-N-acetylmuramyl-L-alanine amidase AmpD [Gammaproteobacteria bacterium]|nr:1,6-anhydro-N-acetylmuramyl-L-alanine amidase AmpD [Gammaproteobacteria bacterium]
MQLDTSTGLMQGARYAESPNCDARQHHDEPEAIIVHCISLPPGEYGGDQVERFFGNQLNGDEHPYFAEIAALTVSAHFFIRRDGELLQFVPTNQRAWHAGESYCLGRPLVNDFSIGIELEGLDTDADGFTAEQYSALNELVAELRANYPKIKSQHLFAHSDIAPGRKPDPGPYFDWQRVIGES